MMKAIQSTRPLKTVLRSGVLLAATGLVFALPVHADEALEIEKPSMRTPTQGPELRVPVVDSSIPYGTELPIGEFGDKPEIVGAREDPSAPRSRHFRTESHEVTPQWPHR